jgi:hypothetical protein
MIFPGANCGQYDWSVRGQRNPNRRSYNLARHILSICQLQLFAAATPRNEMRNATVINSFRALGVAEFSQYSAAMIS